VSPGVRKPSLRSNRERPRLLLVDDNAQLLQVVSGLLAPDFEIVGTATDGGQALWTAPQLDPDVVVLDIEMPGLNGFETARALTQTQVRASVVFLSSYHADELVHEAFACGGRGYVVKTSLGSILASALDHVLAGRRFAPSLTSMLSPSVGGEHAMRLYHDDNSLLNGLADFFDGALRRGDATCILTPREVRDRLGSQLRARGWHVGGSSGNRRYLEADPVAALDRVMIDGFPDADRLAAVVDELDQYRRDTAESPDRRLTLFGNMATLLNLPENSEAALAVERLWSRLTEGRPFFSICAYSTQCFHDEEGSFPHICDRHSAMSYAPHL
jgi:DNA-binding NarL/FixJ family response regulator